jgi:hypothetical protein
MRYVALAALVSGLFAAPAFAQDTPSNSGFRLEAIGGYDRAHINGEHASGVTTSMSAAGSAPWSARAP